MRFSQVWLWPLSARFPIKVFGWEFVKFDLLIMKWLIGIRCAALIGVDPLQKLIVLRYEIILIIRILVGWTCLFLLSDNILVVFQKLACFFFCRSLRATVRLIGLSWLLSWMVARGLVGSCSRCLVKYGSHHSLRVILRLWNTTIRSLILKYDLLRCRPRIRVIGPRSTSRLRSV